MKRLAIIVSVLFALTLSALAMALCPDPISGSSGSSSWPVATYITGVSVHPTDPAILVVTACDTQDSFCAASNITFPHTVFFYDTNPGATDAHAFHGSVAKPLRKFEVALPGAGCKGASDTFTPCFRFYSDVTPGDLANQARIMISPVYSQPNSFGSREAPVGYGFVKLLGAGSFSLRTQYVNASHTGIASQDWPFLCSPG